MKFGKVASLAFDDFPTVDYKGLKRHLRHASAGPASSREFLSDLSIQLRQVDTCFTAREGALLAALAEVAGIEVPNSSLVGAPGRDRRRLSIRLSPTTPVEVEEVRQSACTLRTYCILQFVAALKIVKKHDKHAETPLRSAVLLLLRSLRFSAALVHSPLFLELAAMSPDDFPPPPEARRARSASMPIAILPAMPSPMDRRRSLTEGSTIDMPLVDASEPPRVVQGASVNVQDEHRKRKVLESAVAAEMNSYLGDGADKYYPQTVLLEAATLSESERLDSIARGDGWYAAEAGGRAGFALGPARAAGALGPVDTVAARLGVLGFSESDGDVSWSAANGRGQDNDEDLVPAFPIDELGEVSPSPQAGSGGMAAPGDMVPEPPSGPWPCAVGGEPRWMADVSALPGEADSVRSRTSAARRLDAAEFPTLDETGRGQHHFLHRQEPFGDTHTPLDRGRDLSKRRFGARVH